MAKRLTQSEQHSRALVEWLITDFAGQVKYSGLGKEDLYEKVAKEIGVSNRHLRNWLARGSYPKGLYVAAIESYRVKCE